MPHSSCLFSNARFIFLIWTQARIPVIRLFLWFVSIIDKFDQNPCLILTRLKNKSFMPSFCPSSYFESAFYLDILQNSLLFIFVFLQWLGHLPHVHRFVFFHSIPNECLFLFCFLHIYPKYIDNQFVFWQFFFQLLISIEYSKESVLIRRNYSGNTTSINDMLRILKAILCQISTYAPRELEEAKTTYEHLQILYNVHQLGNRRLFFKLNSCYTSCMWFYSGTHNTQVENSTQFWQKCGSFFVHG